MSPLVHTVHPSPIGELLLIGDGRTLRGLYMPPHRHMPEPSPDARRDDLAHAAVRERLAAYFAGEPEAFAGLVLDPTGTPFQHRVWAALRAIPFGETRSYGELAAALGSPGAARAVGLANGRNPISIVVPCHRVVGADGSLTGYGGGTERKAALLAHERQVAQPRLWDPSRVPMEV